MWGNAAKQSVFFGLQHLFFWEERQGIITDGVTACGEPVNTNEFHDFIGFYVKIGLTNGNYWWYNKGPPQRKTVEIVIINQTIYNFGKIMKNIVDKPMNKWYYD